MEKIILYTDGGSRGNPGPAAAGVVICNNKDQAVKKYQKNGTYAEALRGHNNTHDHSFK